jgi:alanine racemase
MTRPACVVIDRRAAKVNLARVRTLVPHQKVMAIIKANAYGHGLKRMAEAFHDADAFGVACLEEARVLREAGIQQPIVLLEGPFSDNELSELQRLSIETVVHHEEQVRMLELLSHGGPIPVWIKIDTGMHRLGFPPEQVEKVWQRLSQCPRVVSSLRLMTHLASAQERGHPTVGMQLNVYHAAIRGLNGERSIANSSGILGWPETHGDWVRPGIMLYGVSPFGDSVAADEGLRPVMTLQSELIAVRRVRAGEAVGYGGSWRCPEDMPVGVVAMGYGDGYPRHAESGTPVLVNGQRAALIGKASMDMLTVDLRNQPEAKVGDPVVLWGEGLPVEEVARWAGTIPYELLCGVPVRARFVNRHEG